MISSWHEKRKSDEELQIFGLKCKLMEMNWILLIYNIFLQALAVISLAIMIRLVRNYGFPFLKDALVFTAGICLFGFVMFFLQDSLMPLVATGGSGADVILSISMVFLLMPVTLITIFCLIRALTRLVGEVIPHWITLIYWISGVLFMVLTAMAMEFFLRTGIYDYVGAVYVYGFMNLNQVVIYVALGYAHSRARRLGEARWRRMALGWIRLSGAICFFYYQVLMNISHLYWVLISLGLWFYLWPLLPALYLRRRLRHDFADCLKAPSTVADVGGRALRLGLSPREVEIVSLVMAGRSNREMEDELFISESTVKNHLYNIYRKLGVKNRVEMFRKFTES